MKKINKYTMLSLFTATVLFVACDKDDATGDSTWKATKDVTGTIMVPFTGMQNVAEANNDKFVFTVTLDKPQVVPVVVAVKQISGTATLGDDYNAPQSITIPAYATSASGEIEILNDDTVEGSETLVIQIGDEKTSNASIASKTMSFTIGNGLSDSLDMTFNYQHNFSISGTPYSLCGIQYDMDYYVLDASMNDTGIYDAATGACPEHLSLTTSSLPDGTYYIYFDIYNDAGLSNAYHDPFKVSTTVEYARGGGIAPGEFVQEDQFAPSSTAGTGSNYVVTIEKNAGVFTLKNSVPEIIASGRSASASKIKQVIAQARLHRKK